MGRRSEFQIMDLSVAICHVAGGVHHRGQWSFHCPRHHTTSRHVKIGIAVHHRVYYLTIRFLRPVLHSTTSSTYHAVDPLHLDVMFSPKIW